MLYTCIQCWHWQLNAVYCLTAYVIYMYTVLALAVKCSLLPNLYVIYMYTVLALAVKCSLLPNLYVIYMYTVLALAVKCSLLPNCLCYIRVYSVGIYHILYVLSILHTVLA